MLDPEDLRIPTLDDLEAAEPPDYFWYDVTLRLENGDLLFRNIPAGTRQEAIERTKWAAESENHTVKEVVSAKIQMLEGEDG